MESMNDKQRDQVSRWVETGDHVILDEYRHPHGSDFDEDVRIEYVGNAPNVAANALGTSTRSSSQDQLVGAEDDALIPSPADINRVYADGRETWASLLRCQSAPPCFLAVRGG